MTDLMRRKTIQTIALLAHLACDRGIWGPHLIASLFQLLPSITMVNVYLRLTDCAHQCSPELGNGVQEVFARL